MAWTEELIIAEFRTHIAYWQEKLRLRDLAVTVELADSMVGRRWVDVGRRNGGENRSHILVRVRRGWYSEATQFEVWHTCAHELVHVINWAMALAIEPMERQYTREQLHLANTVLDAGNEEIAYKWESILTDWFKADAPPDTIPE